MLAKISHILFHPERWIRWLKYFVIDVRFGKKYLGKMIFNQNEARGYVRTASTDYDALNIIFSGISIKETDIIVDIGCGKGRVFNWFLNQGFKNKLIGLEVDQSVAQFTQRRLSNYPQIEIVMGAIENGMLPVSGTVFYLFHPFDAPLVKHFSEVLMDRIKQGYYKDSNRPLIIYYNCCYLDVFENNPFWKITKLGIVSFMNLPAAIIEPVLA